MNKYCAAEETPTMNTNNHEIVAQLRAIKRLLMAIVILLAVIVGVLHVGVLNIVIVAAVSMVILGFFIRFLTTSGSGHAEKQIE